ncbi:MAG: hypothetical protein WAK83_22345 [Trebonia sp.]|uniref:hypothetical protein n=1 Tax=Trebonia sp. TaxID=2767075 RepID=UPI003BAFCCBC
MRRGRPGRHHRLPGNFSLLAMLLNTFQVDLKHGDQPPFPDVRGFAKVSDPRS